MYGSYGSYSSMSASQMSAPMDIGNTRSTTTCAFPSWPRSTSLSSDNYYGNASSYLSDEDLFLCDSFDDSASSASSASSRSNSNASSVSPPHHHQAQQPFELPQQNIPSEEELVELQRERQAYQRDLVRAVLLEKERRKQAASAARRQRRASSTAPTSSRKKSTKLAVISENA